MLIGNGRIITNDELNPYYACGAVLVHGDEIVDIGNCDDMRKRYPDDEFIDVKDKLIMPGMICAHTHIYSAFARGMSTSKQSDNFLEILENVWWKLDKLLTLRDTRLNAYQTLIESIRNGVTCVFDHHSSPLNVRGSLFEIAEAAKELGVRIDTCFETSDRDGKKVTDDSISENMEFIRAYNNDDQDMIKAHFGMHASFTLSDNTMYKIQKAMQRANAGYHVHVAEGIDDQFDSLNKYGKRVVERLNDFGFLGNKTIAAHCIHTNQQEMMILRDTDTNIVHNPMSNMGNAVGTTPVVRMFDLGCRVGLGTDAYTNDMFESVKVAKILQSHHLSDPKVGFMHAFNMQFNGNAKIANHFYKKELGVLKKGAYADMITLDYKNYTPLDQNTFMGHIIFGLSGRMVNDTIINGKFVMKNREILGVDEDKIFAESKLRAPELWKFM